MDIRVIDLLDANELQPLMKASVDEGYDFIRKLWDEYQSGVNRFNAQGAVLIGVYDGDTLIAIGGVHPDPYLTQATIGRVRHVYVLPEHRRDWPRDANLARLPKLSPVRRAWAREG